MTQDKTTLRSIVGGWVLAMSLVAATPALATIQDTTKRPGDKPAPADTSGQSPDKSRVKTPPPPAGDKDKTASPTSPPNPKDAKDSPQAKPTDKDKAPPADADKN